MGKHPPKCPLPQKDGQLEDYKVGPRKPPLQTRFRKGQSGNPGGKKNGTANLATVMQAVLEKLVQPQGGAEPMSALQALIILQLQRGLKGDHRSIESLLDRWERLQRQRSAPEAERDDADEDQEILDRALRRSGHTGSLSQDLDGQADGADNEEGEVDDEEADDD